MDRKKLRFGAFAIVALLPLLLAASGGFPSRPRFQSLTVNSIDQTPSIGSGSLTVSAGCTTTPAVTARWVAQGPVVLLNIRLINCTANGGLFQLSGVPAAVRTDSGMLSQEFVAQLVCAGAFKMYRVTAPNSSGTMTAASDHGGNCPNGSLITGGITIVYGLDY